MSKKKPLVVVTRKLPDLVETRMRELFDARLNLDDKPMTRERHRRRDARSRRARPHHHRRHQRRHDRPGRRADEADRQFRQRRRSH